MASSNRTFTLTKEQMLVLGLGKDTAIGNTVPPPTFPALNSTPAPIPSNSSMEYKVLWKERFLVYLNQSTFNSDQFGVLLKTPNKKKTSRSSTNFQSQLMPSELNPKSKRKHVKTESIVDSKKKKEEINIDETLERLEKVETTENLNDNKPQHSDSDEDQQDEVEDPEMDEDNDYGENFYDDDDRDEDDKLDDDATYY